MAAADSEPGHLANPLLFMPYPPQAEVDSLRAQLAAKEAELAASGAALAALDARMAALAAKYDGMRAQLTADQQVCDVDGAGGGGDGGWWFWIVMMLTVLVVVKGGVGGPRVYARGWVLAACGRS